MAYSRDTASDITNITRGVADQVAETASTLADKAASKFNDALEGAEASAAAVAGQGREAGQRVQEVAGNVKSAIDKSVKDQPMATLAVAAVLGFVVGALWKS